MSFHQKDNCRYFKRFHKNLPKREELAFVTCFSYVVALLDGYFRVLETRNNHWLHAVLNYIGPNDHQGINVYHNGGHIGNSTKNFGQHGRSNGRIFIGKLAYEINDHYASVEVDELLFYNRALTEDEITMLSESG